MHSIAETLEDNLSRNAPRGFKDVSYDRPPSDRAHLTAVSKEQRAKLLEWSGLRRVNKKGAPLAQRAVDDPVVLKGAVPSVKKRAAGGKARKDENNNIPAGFKLLQLSSFAQLDKAQIYWQELVAVDPALAAYSPIYREVNVGGKMRFRTFIADTESRLRDICRRLAAELKSCLIVVISSLL